MSKYLTHIGRMWFQAKSQRPSAWDVFKSQRYAQAFTWNVTEVTPTFFLCKTSSLTSPQLHIHMNVQLWESLLEKLQKLSDVFFDAFIHCLYPLSFEGRKPILADMGERWRSPWTGRQPITGRLGVRPKTSAPLCRLPTQVERDEVQFVDWGSWRWMKYEVGLWRQQNASHTRQQTTTLFTSQLLNPLHSQSALRGSCGERQRVLHPIINDLLGKNNRWIMKFTALSSLLSPRVWGKLNSEISSTWVSQTWQRLQREHLAASLSWRDLVFFNTANAQHGLLSHFTHRFLQHSEERLPLCAPRRSSCFNSICCSFNKKRATASTLQSKHTLLFSWVTTKTTPQRVFHVWRDASWTCAVFTGVYG